MTSPVALIASVGTCAVLAAIAVVASMPRVIHAGPPANERAPRPLEDSVLMRIQDRLGVPDRVSGREPMRIAYVLDNGDSIVFVVHGDVVIDTEYVRAQ